MSWSLANYACIYDIQTPARVTAFMVVAQAFSMILMIRTKIVNKKMREKLKQKKRKKNLKLKWKKWKMMMTKIKRRRRNQEKNENEETDKQEAFKAIKKSEYEGCET